MSTEIDLYNKRINALKAEIRYLKTAHFKTATKISTMTATIPITFSLYLNNNTGDIYGDKRAIITLETLDNSEMISSCYVNNLTPSFINDNRYLSVNRITSDIGEIKYEVIVISQNYDDFVELSNGGSINLNFTLTLVGSSRFTPSVVYRNFFGGSS